MNAFIIPPRPYGLENLHRLVQKTIDEAGKSFYKVSSLNIINFADSDVKTVMDQLNSQDCKAYRGTRPDNFGILFIELWPDKSE